ncbi:MAG: DUF2779 domain-containing protein [Sediminibacterium sp.]|nr:DUF2779 domain-containing protein [Sediminibacterium sp.]MBP6144152.1 DUF2779 domain-containing protein [Sediminibacterium sp.]
MSRYLTKSKFKSGLECVTKLYYTGKKKEYADQKIDDKFLQALAEGGHQTGALSLFEFCDNPIGDDIIVETLDYDESIRITNEKLARSGKVIIAEAAFKYNHLFIRADIVVKNGNVIDLYEVKAKSFNSAEENEQSFIAGKGDKERIASKWEPYLYDIAFQKYVVTKAFPEYTVNSHLLLVDKAKKATVNGLNQIFQIVNEEGRVSVDITNVRKEQLGESILAIVNTDATVEKIWHQYKVPTTLTREFTFEEFVHYCEDIYVRDERVFSPLTMGCKSCSFWVKPGKEDNLKDGRQECWKHVTQYADHLLNKPWSIDVWQGRLDTALQEGVYLMEKLEKTDLGTDKPTAVPGLDQYSRRVKQVEKVKNNDSAYYFDKENFDKEVASWEWPLNHIDFETSTSALPFYEGKTPYSGVAFQWSHHVMHEDGRIEHVGEYINFDKGVFPNLEFVRTLKQSLSRNNGTIFRYHNHENTYLRMIYGQIDSGELEVAEPEKTELLAFIDEITRHKPDGKTYVSGNRNMVDLYELVQRYYYSPYSKGKVGLKFVLPSIINDVPYLKEKYGKKGIYGKSLDIKSLNFEDHQWIDPAFNNDPYKTLPTIFEGYDRDELDEYFDEMDGIADGGAALSAYAYLQYTHIPEDIRLKLKEALLRYCELDTMAMCFLVEGMMRLNQQD